MKKILFTAMILIATSAIGQTVIEYTGVKCIDAYSEEVKWNKPEMSGQIIVWDHQMKVTYPNPDATMTFDISESNWDQQGNLIISTIYHATRRPVTFGVESKPRPGRSLPKILMMIRNEVLIFNP